MASGEKERLAALGMGLRYTGTKYAGTALRLAAQEPALLLNLAAGLLPAVAARYGVRADYVERNLRYAIACAWRDDDGRMKRFFACRGVYTVPTLRDFFGALCECC